MPLKKMILLVIFLMGSGGCASTSVYVLQRSEVVRVKKSQVITAEWDGWLLSDRAVDRVMNARIKGIQLQ